MKCNTNQENLLKAEIYRSEMHRRAEPDTGGKKKTPKCASGGGTHPRYFIRAASK